MRNIKQLRFGYVVVGICLLGALLTGCSNPQKAKQKYLESGQRYYEKEQYREAAIQFQNALHVDQRFADAHYKLALTQLKLGQWPDAYQQLTTTIALDPHNYDARLEKAKLMIFGHQYPDAKEQLDLLVQKEPKNPDVYLALADYYNNGSKDTAAATAALHTALQLDPQRADAYLSLGVVETETQQWADAEANIKKAAELEPKSPAIPVALGSFYQLRGRFPEAEQAFQRAIRLVPDDPNPRLALAGLYLSENKRAEAENFLRDSKKYFPNNSVGYRLLGDFFWHTSQYDKAEAEYASLYRDHPKDAVVKGNYIQLLILRDHLDDARKLTDELVKSDPSNTDAQVYKGEIEVRNGKANDALNTLQAVLNTDPQNAVAHYQLGLALEGLGNDSRAEAEWRETVRLRPDIVEAHRALANSAIHNKDVAALSQEANQIIALAPAAPDGYLMRAIAEIERKQYTTAEQYIKTSLEKEPNNPAAYVQLGNIRTAENRLADAQKAYQQALDLDPGSSEAMGGVLNVDVTQDQPDRAIATMKAHVAKYPNNSDFHVMLGLLLRKLKKDFAGAEAEFQQATKLNQNNMAAYLNLGLLQSERGDPEAALQTYLEAVKRSPKDIGFYLLAGAIYENKSDWANARQMYQKVLSTQPENPVASNNMAYVMLQEGGNVDVAFQMAQTAHRLLPDNPSSADTLGWAFYHKHVYTSAISLFKEALQKDPASTLYNYHLGLAYARNGEAALAQKQLEHLKPNSTEANDLKQTMAEMKTRS
jgi:cellulose synthase operon protein C